MEDVQGDYRRIALSVAAGLIVLAVITAYVLITRPKTPFEWEHARAEAGTPKGVSVEITTADNRREYREGEPISVIVGFSTTMRYRYKIEIAEGMNPTAADVAHLSNGRLEFLNGASFVCCNFHQVGMTDYEPYVAPTRPLRLAPGKYEIYVTSRRVFRWDDPEQITPSQFQVASNLLKIRVVPDSTKLPGGLR